MTNYRDLFKSTAPYYIRYRDAYPGSLFECLRERFRLTGADRVLDLGCGPGSLAIPMTEIVDRVIAVDPEPEMIAEGEHQSAVNNVINIEWIRGSSEDLPGLTEAFHPFKLVTMGRSFHWMDRETTLNNLFDMTDRGGGVAIIANSTRWHELDDENQQSVHDVFVRYLGERRRAGSGYFDISDRRHEEIVKRSPFSSMDSWKDTAERKGTVDEILGYYLSTSMASPFVLGDAFEGFMHDIRETLIRINPSGVFTGETVVEAILAWK